ncbi:hypothetical protein EV182_001797 [Spiromyces aspiralis]|uniref:Uncharacterized protein n=1 Tax=Spiromyces aspiralis TaxID=68401 RepID=A0ACC1HTI5_9FUNG|nr:hypothetical protein EV182_001797 [Spiromyces aspiralis]
MAVSASSKYFAVASRRGGEVLLVSREKGTQSTFKIPSSQAINAMDISPGYKASVLVGNDGGDLHLFDTVRSSTAPSKTWKLAHNAPIHGLAYSSIERRVAYSVGLDKCLKRVDDASRAGVSLVANVDVPLTSVCCDPVMGWVGVGGMDGLVRVYDVRQSKAPVWKAAVDGDKCVTSVSLSSGPASLVGGGKGNGVHIVRMARSRSDISEYPENSCTNEGPGRVHAVLKPTAREVASRPPINPAISVSKRVNKPRPVSAALPPTSELSAKLLLEAPLPRAASLVKDMYNDSVYLKDRSYMDMFSPVKTAAEASSLRPPSTTKILEDDASPPTSRPTPERGDPPSRRPYEERLGLDRPLSPSEAAAPCPPVACGVATGVVPQTLQSQSPSLLSPSSPPALPPSLRQPVLPAAAGDSMMEIFTPKDRDHRLLKPIRQTSRTSAGSPPHHSATKPIASYSGASVPPCIIPEATAPSGAESAVQASTANGQTTTKELPHTDIQPPSPQVDASHAVTFSGSRPGGPPPTATELKPTLQIFEDAHQPRPTVTGDRIAPSQPGISSSLIQQAVKDAITPFCNQMRNDLLNLHLDIIRQGQECKSYFWVLSQIQNENQELRKEVQRLALENERLRRFLPYTSICVKPGKVRCYFGKCCHFTREANSTDGRTDAMVDAASDKSKELYDEAQVRRYLKAAVELAIGDGEYKVASLNEIEKNITDYCTKKLKSHLGKPCKFIGMVTYQFENQSMIILVTAFIINI